MGKGRTLADFHIGGISLCAMDALNREHKGPAKQSLNSRSSHAGMSSGPQAFRGFNLARARSTSSTEIMYLSGTCSGTGGRTNGVNLSRSLLTLLKNVLTLLASCFVLPSVSEFARTCI